MSELRKIIHVDMDAFYASVEQRDEPRYRGKPLVVGGSPTQRGAVAAASYEARKFGIYSATPSRTAYQRCPSVIFVKPRFEVYRAISQQIREIFYRYTDWVEPLALDEAYLDVTQNKRGIASATLIAQEIKACILEETRLTASAGVSINKFLAKIASGINKPDGLCLIAPQDAEAFVEQLAIEKFHGVGQVTATKMHGLGIRTGKDLKQWAEADLVAQFGKVGRYYYRIARGEDPRLVEPNRVRRSLGAETSFSEDLSDRPSLLAALEPIAQTVCDRLQHHQGRTLTLKIKYADYQQITRSKTGIEPIRNDSILKIAQELLWTVNIEDKKVRLLGITISNLGTRRADEHQYEQLTLLF
jgi:DNA polymerase IV